MYFCFAFDDDVLTGKPVGNPSQTLHMLPGVMIYMILSISRVDRLRVPQLPPPLLLPLPAALLQPTTTIMPIPATSLNLYLRLLAPLHKTDHSLPLYSSAMSPLSSFFRAWKPRYPSPPSPKDSIPASRSTALRCVVTSPSAFSSPARLLATSSLRRNGHLSLSPGLSGPTNKLRTAAEVGAEEVAAADFTLADGPVFTPAVPTAMHQLILPASA